MLITLFGDQVRHRYRMPQGYGGPQFARRVRGCVNQTIAFGNTSDLSERSRAVSVAGPGWSRIAYPKRIITKLGRPLVTKPTPRY